MTVAPLKLQHILFYVAVQLYIYTTPLYLYLLFEYIEFSSSGVFYIDNVPSHVHASRVQAIIVESALNVEECLVNDDDVSIVSWSTPKRQPLMCNALLTVARLVVIIFSLHCLIFHRGLCFLVSGFSRASYLKSKVKNKGACKRFWRAEKRLRLNFLSIYAENFFIF